jgi:GT2 family glycosyltransferase
METNPKAGVCTIRLLYPDGRHQAVVQRFPSVRYKLAELLRLQKLLGRRRGGRFLLGSFFDFQENTQADWVWGAFFMFRRDMLDSLPDKKLNDDYFMYGEDLQWCFDFRKRGWDVWYLSDSEAIHHMGGSSGDKDRLMKKGLLHFYHLNYSWVHRFCISILDKLLTR